MSMARVGDSLDRATTLEAQARRERRVAPMCPACNTPSYPRGFCVNLGKCWTCAIRVLPEHS